MTTTAEESNQQTRPRPRRWERENWQTVAIAPAPPGWLCVYLHRDGIYSTLPAVALLTQECTETELFEDFSADDLRWDVRSRTESHDREVRVVFAVVDYELGELEPCSSPGRDLFGVCTEQEFAQHEDWRSVRAAMADR